MNGRRQINRIRLIIVLMVGLAAADEQIDISEQTCPCLSRELCPKILESHPEVS